ncbi:MAG: sigma factor-like helix-turn-helix DNA-binding protein [Thermomicrobium sp.]|nr:sigma factor-like helix-turn-helix DNA-binding protein [Thermomicrobium sp.]
MSPLPAAPRIVGFLTTRAPRLVAAVRRCEGLRPPGRAARSDHAPPARGGGAAADDLSLVELLASLTPADRQLVELLAAGYPLRAAARRLGIAERTARRRLGRLRRRLGEL